jgi:putative transposase
MSTTVVQAYRFALDPNPEQEAALPSHCGGQRFAFNWGLARVKANLGQRKAEQSCGLAAGELTPSLNWSAYSLRKGWNRAKGVVAPWWGENSKEAYSSGLANLATALTNWSDSTKGKRQVRKLGFPQFKGKRGDSRAGPPPARAVWSGSDRRHMKLPRIAVGVRGGTGGGGEDRTRDKQG